MAFIVECMKLPLRTQDEESTSDGGIIMVTSQQSIQEYFSTKSRYHSRRQECGIQEEHSLAGSDGSYCDQHLNEKTRTKRKRRRRGDDELKESRRQPSETCSIRRSELKTLEGK